MEDGCSETKRVGHFKKTNALERGYLNLYTNWKAFKLYFFKKSFNLLFPASILLSYIGNGSFQRRLQYVIKLSLTLGCFHFSPHFSCALFLHPWKSDTLSESSPSHSAPQSHTEIDLHFQSCHIDL